MDNMISKKLKKQENARHNNIDINQIVTSEETLSDTTSPEILSDYKAFQGGSELFKCIKEVPGEYIRACIKHRDDMIKKQQEVKNKFT